jgi:NADH-quinone oxidoreductase subunit M
MVGLPILSGFVGEFLILSSTFAGVSRGWAIAAVLGVILGAAYMLSLVQRIFYGPQSPLAASHPSLDLEPRELLVLGPVAVLTLIMGVAPSIWLPAIQSGIHLPAAIRSVEPAATIPAPAAAAAVPPASTPAEAQR